MDTSNEKFWKEFNAYESIDWQHCLEEEEELLSAPISLFGRHAQEASGGDSSRGRNGRRRRRRMGEEERRSSGHEDDQTSNENDDSDEDSRHHHRTAGAAHHQQQQQHRRFVTSSNVCLGFFQRLFLSTQVWLAALVVGCCCGLLSATLEVVTHWVTDLKEGVCLEFFGASQELCCLHTTHSGKARNVAVAALASPSSTSAALQNHPGTLGVPDPGLLQLLYAHCRSFMTWSETIGDSPAAGVLVYVFFGTMFAVVASWICTEWAPQAAGSGIVEIKTILSGIQIPGYLSPRVLLVKATTLCLSVGSGLTLGKEGPFVHLGACIGDIVANAFPRYRTNEVARRELISVGAGAGVAVAFGAPIGGVLFAYEEVAKYFPHRAMVQGFLCSIVATLVVKSIDPSHSGRLVQFSVSYRYGWHWFELLGFVVLGIMGGFVGGNLVKYNFLWNKRRKTNPDSIAQREPITEVAIVALATTILCAGLDIPFLRKGMLEGLGELFVNCPENSSRGICNSSVSDARMIFQLLVTGVLRSVLLVVTFGIRVPAGCFVPALFIGACFGRAFGIALKVAYDHFDTFILFSECGAKTAGHEAVCIIPGVYGIVGACAVLAGVTRMTLALVVIMFELTGGLEYVVPCMISAILAKWFAEYSMRVPSVYDTGLRLTCYPYINPESDVDAKRKLHTHTVGDLILSIRDLRQHHQQQQQQEQEQHQQQQEERVEMQPLAATTEEDQTNVNGSNGRGAKQEEEEEKGRHHLITLWNHMTVADLQVMLRQTHFKWYPIVRSATTNNNDATTRPQNVHPRENNNHHHQQQQQSPPPSPSHEIDDSTYVGCISAAQLHHEVELLQATMGVGGVGGGGGSDSGTAADTAVSAAARSIFITFETGAPCRATAATAANMQQQTTITQEASSSPPRSSSRAASTTSTTAPATTSTTQHMLDWSHLLDPCRLTCSWEMPLVRLQKLFDVLGVQFVPVLNGSSRLAAVVTRKDLIAYLRHQQQ